MKKVMRVMIIAVGLWALLAIACDTPPPQPMPPITVTTVPAPTGHTVRYEVEGSAETARMTVTNGTGGTDSGEYTLPFTQEVTFKEVHAAGVWAGIEVEHGTILCRIWLDGVLQEESSASGDYPSVSCSASWW